MDTIALISAARMWRAPEQRDRAEILLDEVLCKGTDDAIESIVEEDFGGTKLFLIIRLESGIQVTVPINY